ncbi:MAG: hypothetical protein KY410_03925, partial [Proteobacteria bacterium]|nr:hypothetical protein [Pseudomonadota bacterium]
MQFAIDLLRNGKGVLLAGLLVALLTGCGGGSDNGDTGNPNPPPAAPPDDGDDDDDDDDDGDDGNDDDGDDGGDNTGATFSNFQAASLVIGQQDFSGGDPDQGGTAPGANTLGLPAGGVDYADAEDVFFVNDSANARTLGFLGIPDTNNANADFVLGQPDFVQSSPKVAEPGGMISPEAVSIGNGNLMITDTDRNRVAVYDGVPTAGGAAPVLAIGQSGVATNPPEGGCNATTLVHPHDHFVAEDGKVLVADAGNNRVLVWNAMPAESGAPADFALGQIDLANCSAA